MTDYQNPGGAASPGGERTAADWALRYWKKGFAPLPVPFGKKAVFTPGWQNTRYGTEEEVRRAFKGRTNVGILCGAPSGGLLDVDLDSPEAIKLAGMLPSTLSSGREHQPHGHRWYRASGEVPPSRSLQVPGKDGKALSLVELRSTGAQTLVAPSVYPREDGRPEEAAVWGEGAILKIAGEELSEEVVTDLGVAVLLLLNYPGEGSRHAFVNAAAGYLIPRIGGDRALEIVERVAKASGDPEVRARIRAAKKTADNLRKGTRVRGGPTLEETFSPPEYSLLDKLKDWIGYGRMEEDGLPDILTGNRPLRAMREDALRVLLEENDPPVLFVRGDHIVRIAADDMGHPQVQVVGEARLSNRLSRVANFGRIEKGGEFRHSYPPEQVIRDILAEDRWQFPKLTSITQTPFLRPDGTIHSTPGYDPATGIYYDPAGEVPEIPENPTQGEVQRAAELIEETIGDFPFDSPASRTNMFALLLTPVLRAAIPGPVPLAAIDKPQAGTGASLLAEIVGMVATGSPIKMNPAPSSEDEMQKLLTTLIGGGESIITFDNVVGEFASASVALALTAPVWRNRLLGANRDISAVQRATWIVTGNNLQIGGDLPRRTYLIRLDAKMSNPWERDPSRFRHPELMRWVSQNRGDLVAALLTLGRSWFVEGCPELETAPIVGGFEGWIRVVGGVIENAESEHFPSSAFLGNRTEFHEKADPSAKEWERFLEEWFLTYSNTPKRIRDVCSDLVDEDDLRDALPERLFEIYDRGGQVNRAMGDEFRKREGRRHGEQGYFLSQGPYDTRKKVTRWIVRPTTPDNTEPEDRMTGSTGSDGVNHPKGGFDDSSQQHDKYEDTLLHTSCDNVSSNTYLDRATPSDPVDPVDPDFVTEERVERLVRQGMSERLAREEVYGRGKDRETNRGGGPR